MNAEYWLEMAEAGKEKEQFDTRANEKVRSIVENKSEKRLS